MRCHPVRCSKVNRCLAEGRKHFFERYARIESGAECERWAPTLSAMVDGEASDADRSAVRPHLKHCAGCRATMRALHHQGRGLEAVLPVGVLGAAGEHGGRDAVGWLTRVYEAVAGGFQERAVGSAAKVHALVEGTSAGKVAAVAASAAAVAGGGVVAADHVRKGTAHPDRSAVTTPAVAQRPAPPPALLTPISTIAARTSTGSLPVRTTATSRAERAAAAARARRRSAARRKAARERARRAAPRSAAAITHATPARAGPATGQAYDRSSTAAADQEFTPAGVGATGPPRTATKPSKPTTPNASTAAETEFSP